MTPLSGCGRWRRPKGGGSDMRPVTPKCCWLLVALALAGAAPGRAGAEEPPSEALSLDLDRAQALALARSPRVREGEAAAAAARARERAAEARLFPTVGLEARYSRLSYAEPGSITLPLVQPDGQPAPSVQLGEAIEDHL
ncbi:MAG: hypothetical protein EP329_06685, partial [Deltaproteobacteria bacterium]